MSLGTDQDEKWQRLPPNEEEAWQRGFHISVDLDFVSLGASWSFESSPTTSFRLLVT